MEIKLSEEREAALTVEVATATLEQLADRLIADQVRDARSSKVAMLSTLSDEELDAVVAPIFAAREAGTAQALKKE